MKLTGHTRKMPIDIIFFRARSFAFASNSFRFLNLPRQMWVANLIRGAGFDAKIDLERNCVVMGTHRSSV